MSDSAPQKLTPMMRQYHEAKKACHDALLFFRMGDFYELFHDDAKIAAQLLGLALTSREKGPSAMPMAGFPHHQLDSYIAKLIAAGYRAAVCEQMEDPKTAKGLVKRAITRIVTAGTVTEEALLDPKQLNYLAAVCFDPKTPQLEVGLSWVELSTGAFYATTIPAKLLEENIARIAPSEVIFSDKDTYTPPPGEKIQTTRRPDWTFSYRNAFDLLLKQFGTATLEGFGFSQRAEDIPAIRAAGAILDYLNETQRQTSTHIDSIVAYKLGTHLEIDEASRRSLEITRSIRGGGLRGSLLDILDRCVTPMGSRLLSEWVASPLTDAARIGERLDAIEELSPLDSLEDDVRENLRHIYDLQRLVTRILQSRSTPRDLGMIVRTLRTLPLFKEKLATLQSPLLRQIWNEIDPCENLSQFLSEALEDELPNQAHEGGFIRAGFDAKLDELRMLQRGGKEWIAKFQAEEIRRSGISTLKVGYTRVFGYYIEITNTHRTKIPDNYIRKQTLKNAERYITPELKEYEERVLTAAEQASALELAWFEKLRTKTCQQRHSMQKTAAALARLDAILSLAVLARERGYCRPNVVSEPIIDIRDGRHPVLDALETTGSFVPNDTRLDEEFGRVQIITGPNMAGKSTFIRQTALLCVMAQIGSFLPARSATIGLCDRIFARVGASDEIARGQSTFMVEMTETARILNQATARSLVILDEIGRGTSTYDGISLAWSIVEYLHEKTNCRTLFATHYHELTDLANSFSGIRNLNVAVRENRDDVAFLHKIVPGTADKSYGIHVAKLAGVPKEVIARSRDILQQLEQSHVRVDFCHSENSRWNQGFHDEDSDLPRDQKRKISVGSMQLSLFGPEDHPIIDEIKHLNSDALTPLEALSHLARWQESLKLRK